MFWVILLLVLLCFGLPLMLVFAAFSIAFWIVGLVLGLVWAVLSFVFHDGATALLVVAALTIGYHWAKRRHRA